MLRSMSLHEILLKKEKFLTLLTMSLSKDLIHFWSFDLSKNRHRIVCADQSMLKFWLINHNNLKINSIFIMFVAMKSWRSKFTWFVWSTILINKMWFEYVRRVISTKFSIWTLKRRIYWCQAFSFLIEK